MAAHYAYTYFVPMVAPAVAVLSLYWSWRKLSKSDRTATAGGIFLLLVALTIGGSVLAILDKEKTRKELYRAKLPDPSIVEELLTMKRALQQVTMQEGQLGFLAKLQRTFPDTTWHPPDDREVQDAICDGILSHMSDMKPNNTFIWCHGLNDSPSLHEWIEAYQKVLVEHKGIRVTRRQKAVISAVEEEYPKIRAFLSAAIRGDKFAMGIEYTKLTDKNYSFFSQVRGLTRKLLDEPCVQEYTVKRNEFCLE